MACKLEEEELEAVRVVLYMATATRGGVGSNGRWQYGCETGVLASIIATVLYGGASARVADCCGPRPGLLLT